MSGFLKSLEKAVSNISSDVVRGADNITRDVNRSFDGVKSSQLLDLFKTGHVVQLVSHSSGHTLQVVAAATGNLVVDGVGPEGPSVYHTHWTIVNEGHNIIRLHNNHNYLAVVSGATVIGSFPPPNMPGPETRFRVTQKGNFVLFESMGEPGRHIGITSSGLLKSAVATGTEIDAQFGVKLIYSPHQQPPVKQK